MLLATAPDLLGFHAAFGEFIASSASDASFVAATTGSPEPYDEFLQGLRVTKSDSVLLQVSTDKWLELRGSRQDLTSFHDKLLIPNSGSHHHWYGTPFSLIIEADDSWSGAEG